MDTENRTEICVSFWSNETGTWHIVDWYRNRDDALAAILAMQAADDAIFVKNTYRIETLSFEHFSA